MNEPELPDKLEVQLLIKQKYLTASLGTTIITIMLMIMLSIVWLTNCKI